MWNMKFCKKNFHIFLYILSFLNRLDWINQTQCLNIYMWTMSNVTLVSTQCPNRDSAMLPCCNGVLIYIIFIILIMIVLIIKIAQAILRFAIYLYMSIRSWQKNTKQPCLEVAWFWSRLDGYNAFCSLKPKSKFSRYWIKKSMGYQNKRIEYWRKNSNPSPRILRNGSWTNSLTHAYACFGEGKEKKILAGALIWTPIMFLKVHWGWNREI